MAYIGPRPFPFFVPPGALLPGSVNWSAFDAPTVAAMTANRNRIINAECRIAQRGGSVVVGANGNFFGGPDRFQATIGASAGGQYTQYAGNTMTYGGFQRYTVQQTVNTPIASMAAGAYWSGIQQTIEGYNVYDFIGQPCTLSFLFQSNVTGNFSVSMSDAPAANSIVSTFNYPVAGVVQRVVLNWPPVAANIPNTSAAGLILRIAPLNQAQYQTSTLNAWQVGNFLTAANAVNWGAAANNYIAVADLQLELGSIATSFERRSIQLELLTCQRYYNAMGQLFGAGYVQNSLTSAVYIIPISPVMRAAPSVTFSGTFTFGAATAGGQNLPSTSMVNASVTPAMLYVQATGLSGVASGQGTILSGLGGSVIALSAEL